MINMDVSDPPPPHMVTPACVELRPSAVKEGALGVWCKDAIAAKKRFGPYAGEVVLEDDLDGNVDFRFAWEVISKETGKLVHVINATKPEVGNWMRYVNCARFFEEQNIVSVQEGNEVFYEVLKDVAPGDELLTWFDPPISRKSRKRRPVGKLASTPASDFTPPQAVKSPAAVDVEPTGSGKRRRKKKVDSDMLSLDDQEVILAASGAHHNKIRMGASSGLRRSSSLPDGRMMSHRKSSATEMSRARPVAAVPQTKPLPVIFGQKTLVSSCQQANTLSSGMQQNTDKKLQQIQPAKSTHKNAHGKKSISEIVASITAKREAELKHEVENGEESNESASRSSTDASSQKSRRSSIVGKAEDMAASSSVFQFLFEITSAQKDIVRNFGKKHVWYVCDACGCKYHQAVNLKRHYLRTHVNHKYLSQDDIDLCHNVEASTIKVEADVDPDADEPESSASTIDVVNDTSMERETEETDTAVSEETKAMSSDGTKTDMDNAERVVKKSKKAERLAKEASLKSRPEGARTTFSFSGVDGVEDAFRCFLCVQLFPSIARLKHHVEHDAHRSKGDKQFGCERCGQRFRFQHNYLRHVDSHGTNFSALSTACHICGKKFLNAANMRKHLRFHSGRNFPCKYGCVDVVYPNVAALVKHLRSVHPNLPKRSEVTHLGGISPLGNLLAADSAPRKKRGRPKGILTKKAETAVKQEPSPEPEQPVIRFDAQERETWLQSHPEGWVETRGRKPRPGVVGVHCTICKKKFSTYGSMCRHRRSVHHVVKQSSSVKSDQSRPSTPMEQETSNDMPHEDLVIRHIEASIESEYQKIEERMEQTRLEEENLEFGFSPPPSPTSFYANVAENIAENLSCYLDGGEVALQTARKHIQVDDYVPLNERPDYTETEDVDWTAYNFPPFFMLVDPIIPHPPTLPPVVSDTKPLLMGDGERTAAYPTRSFVASETRRASVGESQVHSDAKVSRASSLSYRGRSASHDAASTVSESGMESTKLVFLSEGKCDTAACVEEKEELDSCSRDSVFAHEDSINVQCKLFSNNDTHSSVPSVKSSKNVPQPPEGAETSAGVNNFQENLCEHTESVSPQTSSSSQRSGTDRLPLTDSDHYESASNSVVSDLPKSCKEEAGLMSSLGGEGVPSLVVLASRAARNAASAKTLVADSNSSDETCAETLRNVGTVPKLTTSEEKQFVPCWCKNARDSDCALKCFKDKNDSDTGEHAFQADGGKKGQLFESSQTATVPKLVSPFLEFEHHLAIVHQVIEEIISRVVEGSAVTDSLACTVLSDWNSQHKLEAVTVRSEYGNSEFIELDKPEWSASESSDVLSDHHRKEQVDCATVNRQEMSNHISVAEECIIVPVKFAEAVKESSGNMNNATKADLLSFAKATYDPLKENETLPLSRCPENTVSGDVGVNDPVSDDREEKGGGIADMKESEPAAEKQRVEALASSSKQKAKDGRPSLINESHKRETPALASSEKVGVEIADSCHTNGLDNILSAVNIKMSDSFLSQPSWNKEDAIFRNCSWQHSSISEGSDRCETTVSAVAKSKVVIHGMENGQERELLSDTVEGFTDPVPPNMDSSQEMKIDSVHSKSAESVHSKSAKAEVKTDSWTGSHGQHPSLLGKPAEHSHLASKVAEAKPTDLNPISLKEVEYLCKGLTHYVCKDQLHCSHSTEKMSKAEPKSLSEENLKTTEENRLYRALDLATQKECTVENSVVRKRLKRSNSDVHTRSLSIPDLDLEIAGIKTGDCEYDRKEDSLFEASEQTESNFTKQAVLESLSSEVEKVPSSVRSNPCLQDQMSQSSVGSSRMDPDSHFADYSDSDSELFDLMLELELKKRREREAIDQDAERGCEDCLRRRKHSVLLEAPAKWSAEDFEKIRFGKHGKNGLVYSVCSMCHRYYGGVDFLLRHQLKKHPSIQCSHMDVELGHNLETLFFHQPSTNGILAQSVLVPPEHLTLDTYICTRCKTSFKQYSRLRSHILNCDPNTPTPSHVRKKKLKQRNRHRFMEKMFPGPSSAVPETRNQGKQWSPSKDQTSSPAVRQIGPVLNKMQSKMSPGKYPLTSSSSKNSRTSTASANSSISSTPTKMRSGHGREMSSSPSKISACSSSSLESMGLSPRGRKRRNYELLYNPAAHVRRRETAECLEVHQCRGCGLRCKTLSLLERHARKCSGKEKLQSQRPVINRLLESGAKKHSCHYCSKRFTYLKGVANHYRNNFCRMRLERIARGGLTAEDLKHEADLQESILRQVWNKTENRDHTDVIQGRAHLHDDGTITQTRRRGGWPKGVKRSNKRRRHGWTYIKRRKTEGSGSSESKDGADSSVTESGQSTPSTSSSSRSATKIVMSELEARLREPVVKQGSRKSASTTRRKEEFPGSQIARHAGSVRRTQQDKTVGKDMLRMTKDGQLSNSCKQASQNKKDGPSDAPVIEKISSMAAPTSERFSPDPEPPQLSPVTTSAPTTGLAPNLGVPDTSQGSRRSKRKRKSSKLLQADEWDNPENIDDSGELRPATRSVISLQTDPVSDAKIPKVDSKSTAVLMPLSKMASEQKGKSAGAAARQLGNAGTLQHFKLYQLKIPSVVQKAPSSAGSTIGSFTGKTTTASRLLPKGVDFQAKKEPSKPLPPNFLFPPPDSEQVESKEVLKPEAKPSNIVSFLEGKTVSTPGQKMDKKSKTKSGKNTGPLSVNTSLPTTINSIFKSRKSPQSTASTLKKMGAYRLEKSVSVSLASTTTTTTQAKPSTTFTPLVPVSGVPMLPPGAMVAVLPTSPILLQTVPTSTLPRTSSSTAPAKVNLAASNALQTAVAEGKVLIALDARNLQMCLSSASISVPGVNQQPKAATLKTSTASVASRPKAAGKQASAKSSAPQLKSAVPDKSATELVGIPRPKIDVPNFLFDSKQDDGVSCTQEKSFIPDKEMAKQPCSNVRSLAENQDDSTPDPGEKVEEAEGNATTEAKEMQIPKKKPKRGPPPFSPSAGSKIKSMVMMTAPGVHTMLPLEPPTFPGKNPTSPTRPKKTRLSKSLEKASPAHEHEAFECSTVADEGKKKDSSLSPRSDTPSDDDVPLSQVAAKIKK